MKHKIILACLLQALGAAAQQPERNPYWLRFLNDASDNPAFAGLNGHHSLAQRWQHSYSGAYLLNSQYDVKYQSGFPGRASGYAARYQYSYEGLFQRQTAALAYSYTYKLNEKSRLSAGLELQQARLHFQFQQSTWGDQIVARSIGFPLPTNQLVPSDKSYLNMGSGLLFESPHWIAGLEIQNLLRPVVAQYAEHSDDARLPTVYQASLYYLLIRKLWQYALGGSTLYCPYRKEFYYAPRLALLRGPVFAQLQYASDQSWQLQAGGQLNKRLRVQAGWYYDPVKSVKGKSAGGFNSSLVYRMGKHD